MKKEGAQKQIKVFYEFNTRVAEFEQNLRRKFANLVRRGYPEEKLAFKVKIANLKKEAVHITLSHALMHQFKQFEKHDEIKPMLEILNGSFFSKIRGQVAKLFKNKVVTKGDHGLAYVSSVLGLVCAEIDKRLKEKELKAKQVYEAEEEEREAILWRNKRELINVTSEFLNSYDFVADKIDTYKNRKDKKYYVVIKVNYLEKTCEHITNQEMQVLDSIIYGYCKYKGKSISSAVSGHGFFDFKFTVDYLKIKIPLSESNDILVLEEELLKELEKIKFIFICKKGAS